MTCNTVMWDYGIQVLHFCKHSTVLRTSYLLLKRVKSRQGVFLCVGHQSIGADILLFALVTWLVAVCRGKCCFGFVDFVVR
jgi:hypothetical protein